MALPTATAPHSGPVDQPGEGAYLWARSGLARSATTRSNYVSVWNTVEWIVRDGAGAIVSTTDLTGRVRQDTLAVVQALNDEPDTCAFTLSPSRTGGAPAVGQEIRVSWAPGAPALFYGYVVTVQSEWRLNNAQPPWISVQCQDPMWRFDARLVTYRFPAQSVTASIAFLVQWFCNNTPAGGPWDFSTAFVESGMPSIPAFDVVNQRPSTVMRTLMASVGGGFYLDGLTVHAWANSVSEPNQTNPTPLTVGLLSLHTFRMTEDATQVRRRVLVEGRRTDSLISTPTTTPFYTNALGLAVSDASMWPTAGPWLTRFGTQWVRIAQPTSSQALGANPPQTTTTRPFVPGEFLLYVKEKPANAPAAGWVRVGNQYSRYAVITASGSEWTLTLAGAAAEGHPYGFFTVPIPANSTVEWADNVLNLEPFGLDWAGTMAGDPLSRAQVVSTPVVTLATASTAVGPWPALEGFVQDGRYSYAGAQARADADLAMFQDPLVTAEWETDDLNAAPGRSQVIALSSPSFTPAINRTVTVLRVNIAFPLRTLPPRRVCEGGTVKLSTFLDLVVTENN